MPRRKTSNAAIGADSVRQRPHFVRAGWHVSGVVLGFGLLLNSSCAALADEEPVLKPDVPKLDSTVPKSPTMLKGAVQHAESPDKPKAKLSGNANQAHSGLGKFKLFGGRAKSDMQKPLQARAKDNSLNSFVQSGIGIIGVKFVLALGRPPVINRVFPGTPAWSNGLLINDMIVAVDGVPTFGLSKEEVYNMIVGTPGTPVTVTVRRNGDFIPKTMTRMDFNDITDPAVRRDYIMSM
jgi:hypothetical protein